MPQSQGARKRKPSLAVTLFECECRVRRLIGLRLGGKTQSNGNEMISAHVLRTTTHVGTNV